MAETPDSTAPFRRLWHLIRLDRSDVTVVYLYAIFNGLVNLSLPLGIQAIINLIVGGQVSTSWFILVFVVILGIALAGWMQIMQLRITENIQQKIFTRASFDFAWRIPRMKMEALDSYYPPELVNRFFDTMTVQKGISKILIDFSTAGLQVIFGMILLSFYHPFFILFSGFLIILVWLIFRFTGWAGLKTSLDESKHKYEVAHWLEELARSLVSFKMAGRSDLPLSKTDRRVVPYLEARNAHFRILMIQYVLLVFFKVIIAAGLLLVGGFLVIDQQMNVGQFVAAEIIIILVISSVEKLVMSLQTIYDILTSLEKMGVVSDMPLERQTGMPLPMEDAGEGLRLELEDVHYQFPESPDPVLRGVDLTIEAGEKVVIVGFNGSGKSTLIRLIAGLYEAFQGSVTYNNIPLRNLKKEDLRTYIGNSITEDEIFEGSLLENLTLGRENISFAEVKKSVAQAGLTQFVQSLPQGYDTRLGTAGRKLPRSIVRRLILARCLSSQPKLILMEDWLGRIEQADQTFLTDCLIRGKNGWTILAVTNNLAFAQQFDRIVVMKKGQIIAQGTYEQLRDEPVFKAVFNLN